jgi:hypothetical protein
MNMKKVTVTDEDSHGHSLLRADRIPVALQRNGLYTTVFFASRPDSGRIAKKQIIHRCPLRADLIPVALQRNGLYTTVFFASRPDSGRIAKKRIIHHCLFCKQTGFRSHCKETDYTPLSFAGSLVPVALQRNGLYTFCKEVGNIHFLS